MLRTKHPGAAEIITLSLFALVSLISFLFVMVAFIPNAETGKIDASLIPLFSGPTAAGLGSMAMIWLRRRTRPVSAAVVTSVALWFLGVSMLGMGVFTALNPGDHAVLTNLGYSLALCFTPGGIFTLLGLGAYWYDYTKGGRQDRPATSSVEVSSGVSVKSDTEMDIRQRAVEYRRRILDFIAEHRDSAFAARLTDIAAGLNRWEQRVIELAGREASFETDPIIRRDRVDVPARITQLQEQLAVEEDPEVRRQLEETLAGCREQHDQLEQLAGLMRRTRWQLEEALAAMGTIYSQLQMLAAMDIDGSRAAHISQDIEDQTASLADLLAATAEVYGDSAGSQADPSAPPGERQNAGSGQAGAEAK